MSPTVHRRTEDRPLAAGGHGEGRVLLTEVGRDHDESLGHLAWKRVVERRAREELANRPA